MDYRLSSQHFGRIEMATSRTIPFTASDGVKNTLTIYTGSQTKSTAPLVLFLPAMGVPAKKYHHWCTALAEDGVVCAIMDLRGIGASSVRASRSVNFSFAHLIELDIPAALACLEAEYKNNPLFVAGHSLGGQLAALYCGYANTEKDLVAPKGLALVASCSIFYYRWPAPGSWVLWMFTQASNLLAKALGYFPGKKVGFGGTEARGIISDWAYNARTGEYHIQSIKDKSRTNYEPMLNSVLCPTLSINFKDDRFAPINATNHLLGKLRPRSLKRLQFNRLDLKAIRADHYSWMKAPAIPSSALVRWLKEQ